MNVAGLVLARYRRPRLALAALLPAVLAAGATLAILAAAGAAIHLLHVVALLLVLSMGVDYGVFLVESRDQVAGLAASVLSVVIIGPIVVAPSRCASRRSPIAVSIVWSSAI